MEDDLQEKIREAAAALKAAGAKEVYVFGSAAKGTLRQDSDVDLAVSGLPPERFFRAMGKAGDLLRRPLHLIDLDEDSLFVRFLREENELVSVE
jgi:predicted nucleotidyltransferase